MKVKLASSFFILGLAFSASITGVRVQPAHPFYNAGQNVRVVWSYTGVNNPASQQVKITLWRQGGTQNICLIADNVPLTAGQYRWQVPESCVNPHSGQREMLTSINQLKVRVRLKGQAVWGESGTFRVRKLEIRDVRIEPQRGVYLYAFKARIRWRASGFPAGQKVRVMIWRDGGTRNICKVGDNIEASRGEFEWVVGTRCTNPHTGAEEDLTKGRLWIRVGWVYPGGYDGPGVYGESHRFTVTGDKPLNLARFPYLKSRGAWEAWFDKWGHGLFEIFYKIKTIKALYREREDGLVCFEHIPFGDAGVLYGFFTYRHLPETLIVEAFLPSVSMVLGKIYFNVDPRTGTVSTEIRPGGCMGSGLLYQVRLEQAILRLRRNRDGSIIFSKLVRVIYEKLPDSH